MRYLPLLLLLLPCTCVRAQNLQPAKGYSPQIGVVVSMLEDLKRRVTRSVANLSVEETDYLLDEEANRIGAMIYHLAATEKYYQRFTFEGTGFQAEDAHWELAQNLGTPAREKLTGKPIRYYLDLWEEVREETLRLLKTKDDKWFAKKVEGSRNMNNHWAWYHVMEHQANHMGQIRMITKRLR
ncbi:MAG: DinB family protein [Bacteroidota bacterium]